MRYSPGYLPAHNRSPARPCCRPLPLHCLHSVLPQCKYSWQRDINTGADLEGLLTWAEPLCFIAATSVFSSLFMFIVGLHCSLFPSWILRLLEYSTFAELICFSEVIWLNLFKLTQDHNYFICWILFSNNFYIYWYIMKWY